MLDVEVEVLVAVTEDAESGKLVGGPVDVGGGVVVFDGGEDEEAGADGADGLVGDDHFCFEDALDDGDHGGCCWMGERCPSGNR